MKLHLPLLLRSSLLAAFCLSAAGTGLANAAETSGSPDAAEMGDNWGNTIYIGDSISHGFNVQPYRWFLFKILVDNGISQTEVGIQTGYYHSSISTQNTYGNSTFDNLHATQSGITAAQVAREGSGKFDGSGLVQWLGQDSTYTGSYKVHSSSDTSTLAPPSTAFIMIGTNDIFNATNVGYLNNSTLATHTANMTRYLESYVAALKEANPNVNIVINSIPTWSENRKADSNGQAENWQALASLNASLQQWAEQQEGVTFVDINKGMVDVANTAKPGAADVAFCSDTQHPNAQGNLLIAGNMAQQLGYAGRTAGQLRVDAADTNVFTHQAADIVSAASTTKANVTLSGSGSLDLASGATLSASWNDADNLESGFTVDFSLANGLGNGSTDGWNTSNNFSLSVGDGSHAGTLNVNEAYIQWGSTLLYSMDASTLTDSLRVAYIEGNTSQGLSSGFYVWMGDMLIGEALSGSGTTNGLNITNGSGSDLTLTHLSMAAGAWAPTTSGYSAGNPLIETGSTLPTQTVALTGIGIGNTGYAIRNQSGIASGNNAVITVDGASQDTNWLVASNGNFTGDVDITLGGIMTKNSTGEYNVIQYEGTLDGSISFTLADDFVSAGSNSTWNPITGAEGATVKGNISMEFNAAELTIDQGVSNKRAYALAGTNGGNVEGSISIAANAGRFIGNIYGGAVSNHTIGKGTSITIGDKAIVTGNVFGGGTSGTIDGGSSVTIWGNASISGNVYAGGADGTINGGTQLVVKDASNGSAFANYAGILSGQGTGGSVNGTRALCFDNVQLSSIGATLQNFDSLTVKGKSDVGLSSLGGATTLSIEDGSRLALTGGSHSAVVLNSGTVAVGHGASLTVNGAGQDGNLFGKYEVHGGDLTITGYDHLSTAIHISSGSLGNSKATILDGGVNVSATGAVELNNVALADVSSFAVQEGGSVSATLDAGNVRLNGITSLSVSTVDGSSKDVSLSANSADLTLSTGNSAPSALALGETGSLTVGTLNISVSGESSLTSTGEGRLWVNQGSLSAGSVNINATLGANQTMSYTGIGSEGGNSYVAYKLFTTTQQSGQSYGNESNAIANTAQTGSTSGNVAVSVDGGTLSTKYLVAHSGAWNGDVHVSLDGEFSIPDSTGYNVAHYKGSLEGDVSLVLGEDFRVKDDKTLGTFVGTNGGSAHVHGDINMEFSSGDLTVGNTHQGCAVAGVSGGNADGKVSITVNAGTFNGSIYGGSVNVDTSTIGEGTEVSLYGGTVTGNVYGAGKVGTITEGGSAVTVTGDANVQSATVGSKAIISAGGTGGSIQGGTLLTVKDVTETDSFASFSGILSGNEGSQLTGTRTLCFDGSKLSQFTAELRNFDVVNLIGQSDVLLNDLGDAHALNIEEGSRVSLANETSFSINEATLVLGSGSQSESASALNNRGGEPLTIQTLTLDLTAEFCEYMVSSPATMAFTAPASAPIAHNSLEGKLLLGAGTIEASTININLAEGYGNYSIASTGIKVIDGYSYVNYSLSASQAIPEPTSATLSLLALAGLAARRRRKD